MEKELISIVVVLKELHTMMLLGAALFTYTVHKNKIFATLNCCHVLSWYLYVEEYSPIIIYHPGKKNIIANTLKNSLRCVANSSRGDCYCCPP